MRFSRVDSPPLKKQISPERKFFKCLSRSTMCCVAVIISLCQIPTVVAMESGNDSGEIKKEAAPVLGDPNYKPDPKYWPIHGSPRGKSFFLHYCLPGFVPQGLGDCKVDLPGRDPRGVQVHYKYSLDGRDAEYAMLEGFPAYAFPFPVNIDIEGKTPYLARYKEMAKRAKETIFKIIEHQGESKNKYSGLVRYDITGISGLWFWAPANHAKYTTKLGNPPIFSCASSSCTLVLDQGNGWVVDAIFNEAVLNDWQNFFVQLNNSIMEVME